MARKKLRVLPGFRLTLGYTLLYLSLIVLIPLAAMFVKTSTLSWAQFWHIVTVAARAGVVSPELRRVVSGRARQRRSSASSSRGCWCATNSSGKQIVDALVDLPFALPTAVAGITLTALLRAERLDRPTGSRRSASRSPTRSSACSSR